MNRWGWGSRYRKWSLRLHSTRCGSVVPSHAQILGGDVWNHTGLSYDPEYTIPQSVPVILGSNIPPHVDWRMSGVSENVRHDLDVLVNTSLHVHLETAEHDRDEPGEKERLSASTWKNTGCLEFEMKRALTRLYSCHPSCRSIGMAMGCRRSLGSGQVYTETPTRARLRRRNRSSAGSSCCWPEA